MKNSLHACNYLSNLAKERQSCEKRVSHLSISLAVCPYCAWVAALFMLALCEVCVKIHLQDIHVCVQRLSCSAEYAVFLRCLTWLTEIHASLVLKARHLGGSAFCNFYRLGVPEQALGGSPRLWGCCKR